MERAHEGRVLVSSFCVYLCFVFCLYVYDHVEMNDPDDDSMVNHDRVILNVNDHGHGRQKVNDDHLCQPPDDDDVVDHFSRESYLFYLDLSYVACRQH